MSTAIKEWQNKLHKAFSLARPRGVRFQFFTDYDGPTIELWREGGAVPVAGKIEVNPHETWHGFEAKVKGDDLTEDDALAAVKGLFKQFEVKAGKSTSKA